MERPHGVPSGILTLAAVTAFGCEPAPPSDSAMDIDTISASAPARSSTADTTVQAVQAHLDVASYAENWSHWPDRSPMYQGQDPHGMLLATYLNPRAEQGLQAMMTGEADALPFGSIVVKENYAPDSMLVATTVMYKQQGYDSENHDWFWMKRLADGTVETAGRADGCISCHSAAADSWDYLMTARADAAN